MTEEEARKKWCPHIRVNGNNRSYSRTPPEPHLYRCIASDCMMWEETTELVGSPPDDGDCGLKRKDVE